MKIIDIENHFTTPRLLEIMGTRTETPRFDPVKGLGYFEDAWCPIGDLGMKDHLLDVDEGRIALLDNAGIDFVQLSLQSPGAEPFEVEVSKEVAEDVNNYIAAAIKKHPTRLGAFMTLAPKDPDWSLNEIDRCLDMGLWGWHTHSNFGDAYLDERRFWPILKKCEALDMPIYIHPAVTAAKDLRTFGICLAAPSFGFTVDTIWCFMRMIHRGVFDEFPNLKIILGHYGEGLPFFYDRVNAAYRQGFGMPDPEIGTYKNEPGYYIGKNLWATSSGNFLPQALYLTKDVMGIDKVMVATDHPYEDVPKGIDMIRKDDKLSEEEKTAFLGGNAQALGFGKNI